MSTTEQEKVSSCLLARVNVEGKSVIVDMFGPMSGFDGATSQELATYSAPEGVFFGNVFAATPQAFVCGLDVISRDEFRACIGADCGIVSPIGTTLQIRTYYTWGGSYWRTVFALYNCFDNKICGKHNLTGGYSYASSCTAGGRTWSYPMTTNLAPAPPGGECYGTYQCDKGLSCVSEICQ
jgi:hypothetical protein